VAKSPIAVRAHLSSRADGDGLTGANGVAMSADGRNVYVTSANAVVGLRRNPRTGALNEPPGSAGCISEDGSDPCADGRALSGAYGAAVSADGKSVYVASLDSAAVARLERSER
jgi:DNA-binding beta-propeller fold protein YncE